MASTSNLAKTRTYSYEPLQKPLSEIRLVKVQAGKNDEEIVCSMQIYSLEEVRGTYTCLSYTWGTDAASKSITINQKTYLVRPNLWNFFHTARRYGCHGNSLWIDAICINQSDEEEKGKQISIMGDIYQQAEKVIVWLGLTDAQTLKLLALQDFIDFKPPDPANFQGADYCPEWEQFVQVEDWTPGKASHLIMRLLTSRGSYFRYWRRVLSYRELFEVLYVSSSYWTRAWIVQEFCMGKFVYIMSPNRPINAETITRFAAYFRYIPENVQQINEVNKYEPSMLKVCDLADIVEMDGFIPPAKQGCARLHRFLDLVCRRECYDPRDRIYSILSLLRAPYVYPIRYGKSFHEELWDIVMYILVLEQSFTSESLLAMSPAFRALFTASPDPLPRDTIWDIRHNSGGRSLVKRAYITRQSLADLSYFQGPALDSIKARNAHWSLCIPYTFNSATIIIEFHAEHYGISNTPDPQLLKVVVWEDKGPYWEAHVRDGFPEGPPPSVLRFRQSIKEAPPLKMWQVGVGRLYMVPSGDDSHVRYHKVDEALAKGKQETLPLIEEMIESLKLYFSKN